MLKLSSRGLQFLDSWDQGLSGLTGTSVMVPMVAVPRERSVPTLDTPRPAPYSPQTRLSGSHYQAEPLRVRAPSALRSTGVSVGGPRQAPPLG